MTDAAVPPHAVTGTPVTTTPVTAASPSPVVSATSEQVADLFGVLATSAHWSGCELQEVPVPVATSAVERVLADTVAADARAQLARVDPPVLLAGVAAWTARNPEAADAALASVSGRIDVFWPAEAGA